MEGFLSEKKLKTRGRKKGKGSLKFGDRLRHMMNERGLTVREVAELADLNNSVIQSWISNAHPHNLAAVARLAKALQVGFKELLLGEPEDIQQNSEFILEENPYFDGICHLSIKKVISRKQIP